MDQKVSNALRRTLKCAVPGAGTVRTLSPFSAVGKALATVLRSIVDARMRVIHKEMGSEAVHVGGCGCSRPGAKVIARN